MPDQMEHFASDQSTAIVVLRHDLRFTAGDDPRQPHMIVEDPVGGAFYRLGKIEFALASLLTRGRTVAEAYRILCERFPDHRLSETDAAELCRWLISVELAHTDSSKSAARIDQLANKADTTRIKQRVNPIAIRIPLLHPDRLVSRLTNHLGWIFGPIASVAGIVSMIVGGSLAVWNWNELAKSSDYLFSASSLFLMAAIMVVLKIVHEFAHAIVCKRYGGDVGEMGVLLILLAPLAYVDVTSIWRFRSKWQRIHVAMAGIYVELLVASFAMLIWHFDPSPMVRHICAGAMFSASAATILFNANPLMKFDGYFALIDLTHSPNLYTDSQQHLLRHAKRLFLGDQPINPAWSPDYRMAVTAYGWLALAWKGFVCIGLMVAAAKLFHGLGIVLAAAALVGWIGLPAWRTLNHVRQAPAPQRRRFALVTSITTAAMAIILAVVPWPGSDAVSAVVEFSAHEVIRAETSGFVDAIHVTHGQAVAEGQKLMNLRNEQLVASGQKLETQIQQSKIRMRQKTLKGQRAAAQAESAERDALTKKHAEILIQIDRLTIRAPQKGIVVRRGLDALIGTYIAQGDEILVVGDDRQKELRLLISQSKYDQFRDHIDSPVRYRTGGLSPQTSSLTKIIPRATTQALYPALVASSGGPLAVKARSDDTTDSQSDVELLTPHFEAVVTLDPAQGELLRSGQRACVSLGKAGETVGSHLWDCLIDWLKKASEGQR